MGNQRAGIATKMGKLPCVRHEELFWHLSREAEGEESRKRQGEADEGQWKFPAGRWQRFPQPCMSSD